MSEVAQEGMICITRELYEELQKDSAILYSLRRGGVENWEWYYESLSGLDEDE